MKFHNFFYLVKNVKLVKAVIVLRVSYLGCYFNGGLDFDIIVAMLTIIELFALWPFCAD